MNTKNYQERIAALNTLAKNEKYNAIDSIVAEMLDENERVWSINRRWQSYGTWKVSLWVNEYTWGHELADMINRRCYFITHDEDKEFELAEFEEMLTDICTEYLDSIDD